MAQQLTRRPFYTVRIDSSYKANSTLVTKFLFSFFGNNVKIVMVETSWLSPQIAADHVIRIFRVRFLGSLSVQNHTHTLPTIPPIFTMRIVSMRMALRENLLWLCVLSFVVCTLAGSVKEKEPC